MNRINTSDSFNSGPEKIIKKNTPSVPTVTNAQQWAHTKSTLNKIYFKWTIDNYSFRQGTIGHFLESPIFTSNSNNTQKWRLKIFPNGETREDKEFVPIFLVYQESNTTINQPKILGLLKMFILNTDPKKTLKVTLLEVCKSPPCLSTKHSLKRAFLLDKANGFLPGDTLTIICVLNVVSDSYNISSTKGIGQFKVPESKITNDLAKLFASQEFSDVTLVVDEYKFPAHKAILAARSDVFAAMFKHDMEELRTGQIIIIDVKHEVLQEMLYFIYTEEVPKLKEMANDLLAAADKYALKKLKVMCEERLYAKLSIETAAEILILADLHSAEQLKEQTIRFIVMNAKEVIKTEGWQNMIKGNAHSVLINETLEASIIRTSNNSI